MQITTSLSVRLSGFLVLATATLLSMPSVAQVTPSDVRDLVGARAAGAESELASRGYVIVGGHTGKHSKSVYWWNERRGVCLAVDTKEGRYDSVVTAPAADCRQGNSTSYKLC